MQEPEHLRAGLPRLVEFSGVGLPHLSRLLKAHCGLTATEFVRDLRLRRAATLLQTTSQEIASIAYECGCDHLPYFYRLFRRRYSQTPLGMRREAQRIPA